jgi:hypothetical protein
VEQTYGRLEFLRDSMHPLHVVPSFPFFNAAAGAWQTFTLWPAQRFALCEMHAQRMLVILKARQLGLTWLALAYALWMLIFHVGSTVLLFSLRGTEASEMLMRLREMLVRLPAPLQPRRIVRSTDTLLHLSNHSRALAFSTRAGRSYTGNLAIVDEADYIPHLETFLNGVKPTIDAGGKLFLISTSDKSRPLSVFKNLFRAALKGVGDYHALFLPWHARPERDAAWYARTRAEMHAQRGTDDDFLAEYPATPEEALAAETRDRRFAPEWIAACRDEATPMGRGQSPLADLPGLTMWEPARPGCRYLIAADPAEGRALGDESAATVFCADPLEAARGQGYAQVAELATHAEPGLFAHMLHRLSTYYNAAPILPERNNHGHALILALDALGAVVMDGYDGRAGWLNNVKGKPLMYDLAANLLREGAAVIRGGETAAQLASIQASNLSAPEGMHDDRATAFVLGLAGLAFRPDVQPSVAIPAADPLAAYDAAGW